MEKDRPDTPAPAGITTEMMRCPCCRRVRVSAILLDKVNAALVLAHVKPVVTSGFRCPVHNQAVGGEKNSAHLTGQAVDLAVLTSGDRFRLVQALLAVGVTRIGIGGRGFIHVDVSESLPQRVMWTY